MRGFFLLLSRLKSLFTYELNEPSFTQLTVKTELKIRQSQQLLPLSLISLFLEQVNSQQEVNPQLKMN